MSLTRVLEISSTTSSVIIIETVPSIMLSAIINKVLKSLLSSDYPGHVCIASH